MTPTVEAKAVWTLSGGQTVEAVTTAELITDTTRLFPVGVSLGKGNWGGLTGWPVHRIYVKPEDPWPADITRMSNAMQAINDGTGLIHVSWKHKPTAAQLAVFVGSWAKIPNVTIKATYFHEMEDNNQTASEAAAWLVEFQRQRQIMHDLGQPFQPTYQAWTFNPKSGRDWERWWDDGADALYVEAYNPGRKKTPPVFEPAGEFLDRVFDVLAEVQKPTAAPEFGMPVDPSNPNTRPQKIVEYCGYYRTDCPVPVDFMAYWDSIVTNDNRLDRAAALALMGMNAA